MKTLVVYDSLYGNTKIIAQAIGDEIPGEVQVLQAGEVNVSELGAYDLLIVGAPTHGSRPSDAVRDMLEKVQTPALKGTQVAAFDTRLTVKLARVLGFAAPRIAESLTKKGATLVGAAEGFFVMSAEGPLKGGEVERAAAWAKEIVGLITLQMPVGEMAMHRYA
jgi:flavodoxin